MERPEWSEKLSDKKDSASSSSRSCSSSSPPSGVLVPSPREISSKEEDS
jgi:hypothetical protein